MNRPEITRFTELREEIAELPSDSQEFQDLLFELKEMVDNGLLDGADLIAEIFAFDEIHRNPQLAYKYYNISKSSEGYSVAFNNISGVDGHYSGLTGDFRNEAQVCDLVNEIGFERCKQIDQDADNWRAHYQGI